MVVFEANTSILYSDTLVPDVFISEYLPSMDGDAVKIYLHCLFLSKHHKSESMKDLSKKLNIEYEKVRACLIYLESQGVIKRKENTTTGIIMNDLKAAEISRHYRLKTTSTPEEAVSAAARNNNRESTISAIVKKFFQGIISPAWYLEIDNWFDTYQFEGDVVFALFQYCYDRAGLSRKYYESVAKSWFDNGIKTGSDLDNYFHKFEQFKLLKTQIKSKLKMTRPINEYEEQLIDKWSKTYKFDMNIIELALKKTTSKSSTTFDFFDKVLTSWHDKGLKTVNDIESFEKARIETSSKSNKTTSKVPQKDNYYQRNYSDDDYENLYDNMSYVEKDKSDVK